MAQFGFKTQENGYCKEEVDRYVQHLQNEYRNAVEWSNEIEKKAEESGNEACLKENEELRVKVDKLTAECRILSSKLKELTDGIADREAFDNEQSSRIIKEAEGQAADVIRKAGEECQSIISDAEKRVALIKDEIQFLSSERDALTEEVKSLRQSKEDISSKIQKAQAILNA